MRRIANLEDEIYEFRSGMNDVGLFADASVAEDEAEKHAPEGEEDQWISMEDSGIAYQSIRNQSNIEILLKDLPDDQVMTAGPDWLIQVFDREGNLTEAGTIMEEAIGSLSQYPVLDDQDYSKREYDAQIEAIEVYFDSTSDAAPNTWEDEVFKWLWENNQQVLEPNSEGLYYVDQEDVEEALKALGWLEEDDW